MNNSSPETDTDVIDAIRAVRFGLATIVIGMAYPNIRCALGIYRFENIFHDMLGGKPLPGITIFVLQMQPILLGLSALMPLAAMVFLFVGRLSTSIYVSGGLILATFFQLFFTTQALSAPLFEIIRAMGGTP